MKKIFYTIVFFAILGVTLLHAQTPVPTQIKGFYMSAHGGYNLGIANEKVGFFGQNVVGIHNINENNTVSNPEEAPFSFGEGINAGVAIGYLFNDKFGAELAVNYLAGSKTTTKQEYTIKSTYRNFDQDISAKMIQISPLIVMKGKSRDFTPYAKAGAIIGLMPKITYNEKGYVEVAPIIEVGPVLNPVGPAVNPVGPVLNPVEPVLNNVSNYESSQEASGKFSIGIVGIAGVDYAIKRNMSLFTEIRAVGLNYSPEKATLTKYQIDGVDQLATLNTFNKETEFTDNSTSSKDLTQPRQVEKIKLPFSSIGLNFGFKYSF